MHSYLTINTYMNELNCSTSVIFTSCIEYRKKMWIFITSYRKKNITKNMKSLNLLFFAIIIIPECQRSWKHFDGKTLIYIMKTRYTPKFVSERKKNIWKKNINDFISCIYGKFITLWLNLYKIKLMKIKMRFLYPP